MDENEHKQLGERLNALPFPSEAKLREAGWEGVSPCAIKLVVPGTDRSVSAILDIGGILPHIRQSVGDKAAGVTVRGSDVPFMAMSSVLEHIRPQLDDGFIPYACWVDGQFLDSRQIMAFLDKRAPAIAKYMDAKVREMKRSSH